MEKKKIIIILVCILAVLVGTLIFTVAKDKAQDETNASDSSYSQEDENSEKSSQNSEGNAVKAENEISETGENSADGESVTQKNNAQSGGSSGSKTNNTQSAQNSGSNDNKTPEKTTQKQPEKTTAKETEKQNITVSISITCKNAVDYVNSHDDCDADVPQSGYFLKSSSFTVKNGSTVFDVLSKACSENSISLSYSSPSYITGIGGLNEKDCGRTSGWMYRVNGSAPPKSINKYVLSDGDTIEWYYVTSPSDN